MAHQIRFGVDRGYNRVLIQVRREGRLELVELSPGSRIGQRRLSEGRAPRPQQLPALVLDAALKLAPLGGSVDELFL